MKQFDYLQYIKNNRLLQEDEMEEAPTSPAEDSANYQDKIDDMDELVGPQITEIVTMLHDKGYNVNEVTKFFEYIAKETKNFYEFHFDETDNVDMSAGRGEMDAPTSI